MSLRSPMARARGLGSAHEGVAHWWAQRLSAAALVPLMLWFVGYVCTTMGEPFAAARQSLHAPVNAILTILMVSIGFYHGHLGLSVVIEDYVHTAWFRLALLVSVKAICLALGVATVFAVLKIALSG
jgi:succinate dehydrogenase membrane anchor subunit